MSEKRSFGTLRKLLALTIALGAIIVSSGCSSSGGPAPKCDTCGWDYAHGGTARWQ